MYSSGELGKRRDYSEAGEGASMLEEPRKGSLLKETGKTNSTMDNAPEKTCTRLSTRLGGAFNDLWESPIGILPCFFHTSESG
jgi:hypothetical protein